MSKFQIDCFKCGTVIEIEKQSTLLQKFNTWVESNKDPEEEPLLPITAIPSKDDTSSIADVDNLAIRIGMLRQWLNEDRITDSKKMVTNEQIYSWLEVGLENERQKAYCKGWDAAIKTKSK